MKENAIVECFCPVQPEVGGGRPEGCKKGGDGGWRMRREDEDEATPDVAMKNKRVRGEAWRGW